MKLTPRQLVANIGLVCVCTAVILFLLPHDDRQSYNYELNQPWRYQLLTADFDTPILRDSTSAKRMRDSIDRAFIPFVRRDASVATNTLSRTSKALHAHMPAAKANLLTTLIAQVYDRGIIDAATADHLQSADHDALRTADKDGNENLVHTIDATQMLSPSKAFRYIDSVYRAAYPNEAVDEQSARMIGSSLTPNFVLDTLNDNKFRAQEYLLVNGATGVIKKGQRIVDRGEIITPQIFTNLNTYLEIAEQNHQTETSSTYFLLGQLLYVLLCFCSLYAYLRICRPRFLAVTKNMVFLITFVTLFEIFAILMFEYVGNGIYFVPFAAIPIVVSVFFDSRTAIFSLLITVMIGALVAVFPFQFIFLELTAGLTAAFSMNNLERRSQLLRSALLTFVAYLFSYTVCCLVTDGRLEGFDWHVVGAFAINSVILSFAYFLILIVERTYGLTSSVTLVELSDINNPLLRRLAEEAPGTFQHSMQVSTLAAEAARAIGANTQLVRTGALYHDIGKLDGPVFFTENQHGINPHTGLNPETSAHKIISHVTSGLTIAQREKLPAVLRDFISEHHGRSLARYFYNTAINEAEDPSTVDKAKFTYPGPNPQSRETAVLMMADCVEAASRSMQEYTPEKIDALVNNIIDTQEKEGLFNESPISFRDIDTIKRTFKKRLSTIYHTRVAYPGINKKEKAEDKK